MKPTATTSKISNSNESSTGRSLSRRRFVGGAAALLGGAGLLRAKASWAADEGPETTDLKFGMIALTDCSPIVIAHEKGLFKKYGINSTVVKGASWAA
ncbi:MAG TPA: ABC transporter substrate-binding protein, partial [Polyangia bacterium]